MSRVQQEVPVSGPGLKAAVQQRLSAVTSVGWSAILGCVLCAAVGTVFGWSEFIVLAGALLAGLVMAALFLIGRANYAVKVTLLSKRVVVGEPATAELQVCNAGSRRLLPNRMELPVGVAVSKLSIPSLASGAEFSELFNIPTNRRAVIPLGPARSVRGDAFGLFRRVVRWSEPELLYVHPRTVPLLGAAAGFIKDLEGEATKQLSNSDISFHALRGYVPGDDRRYIHWKTSARTGTLMVRQFEETRRSHLVISLTTNRTAHADDEEFELCVAAAASLGVQSDRDARKYSVVTERKPLIAPTASRLLDRLTEIEIEDNAPGLVQVCQNSAAAVPDVSVAVMICGSNPTPGQIRRAGASYPAGVRVLAIRAVPGAAVSIRSIGNVDVVTVGALDELGRALRSVPS